MNKLLDEQLRSLVRQYTSRGVIVGLAFVIDTLGDTAFDEKLPILAAEYKATALKLTEAASRNTSKELKKAIAG